MELILATALKQVAKADPDVDLADQLVSLKLGDGAVKEDGAVKNDGVEACAMACKCTRKCKTKLCPCFNTSNPCNALCHPHNNDCTNVSS